MGVQAYGEQMDGQGHERSMAAFVESHESNSKALINLANGRKQNAPTPPYDPTHPDNKWPMMVHHPAKGEKPIGTNLKGVTDVSQRVAITKANEADLKEHLATGWRKDPYVKPQITVLDAATEKAALVERNRQLEGGLVAANDLIVKMEARLAALEKGAAD